MGKAGTVLMLLLFLVLLTACKSSQSTEMQSEIEDDRLAVFKETSEEDKYSAQVYAGIQESEIQREENDTVKIQIIVGDSILSAVPEKNSSAEAFLELLQKGLVTVRMSDYAGMEKVGQLGVNLPRNDTYLSVDAGDVILYQGNQITIYYGANSWNFTKLAVIEDVTKERLLDVLGMGDVEVTFSLTDSLT